MAYPNDLVFDSDDVFLADRTGNMQVETAGEPLLPGEVVYKNADGEVVLADCLSADAASAVGITLDTGVTGQPVVYADLGDIDFGVYHPHLAMTYVLSDTPGKIMPIEHLSIYQYLTYIGYTTALNNLQMMLTPTGIQWTA